VVSTKRQLSQELRNTGLTQAAIDAVWPAWWSAEAEGSLSARTELRYTIARRLGISPSSLFEGSPKFVWRDAGKFKNLGTTSEAEQFVLTSFGVAAGRALIDGTPPPEHPVPLDPLEIRAAILQSSRYVGLHELLSLCWSCGIPVIKTEVFPLRQKRMQAMTVRNGPRYAVILGRSTRFPAWVAFILAHEIGHITRQHLADDAALLEMADPVQAQIRDEEEVEADRFALALLTGSADFSATTEAEQYSARQVAYAAASAGPEQGIDPGVLSLCLAHNTGRWKQAIGALKVLDGQQLPVDVGRLVNGVADRQLDWDALTFEQAEYLTRIMANSGK
jgi:hypothetical protein